MSYTKEDFDRIIELLKTRKGKKLTVKYDRDYSTATVDGKEYDADFVAFVKTFNRLDDDPHYLKRIYLEKNEDKEWTLYFDLKWTSLIGARVYKDEDKHNDISSLLRKSERLCTNDKFLKNIISLLENTESSQIPSE